jgi:hypothetical protein
MILVLDLDRTLNRLYPASARSIRDLAPPELRAEHGRPFWDWVIAHLLRVVYPPHETAVAILRLLSADSSRIVVNTGRPEALREVSENWIQHFLPVDEIRMRANDDFRPTAQVKRDNIDSLLRAYPSREIFAFDDNEAALRTYSEAKITSLRAPECWTSLLAAMRSPGEKLDLILKRCAFSSNQSFDINSIDH